MAMHPSHDLHLLFSASLSADLNSRLAAETQLQAINNNDGFLSALFSLVADNDNPLPIRQAAAIYLKNTIKSAIASANHKNLNNSPAPLSLSISESDATFFKSNLLNALSKVPTSIRSLLIPSLALVIGSDYPNRWNDLLPQTINLISSNSCPAIEAGLLSLLEIIRLYRWSGLEKSHLRSNVICPTFPILLQISQSLLSNGPDNYPLEPRPVSLADANSIIGTILYLVLKIYKTSITAELPAFQQQHIIPWGQLFLAIVRTRLQSAPGFPSDQDDRNRWGWSKAKKWAYVILNRLYSRYGSPSQLPVNMLQYKPFADNFIACFACPILQLYLEQVQLHVEGHDWMSKKVICHTIVFFEESIRPKETWSVLKAHIQALLPGFIFPLLCITPDEVQEFESQPEEYAKSQFGEFFEDLCSTPSTNAAGFVLGLASGRKKTMFMSLLAFITNVCEKYPTENSPRDKDGALRSLAHLATVITETRSIRPNIEDFFLRYVFPEFESEHAFLRARTCEVIRKFESAGSEWSKPELLSAAYQGVMQCLSDRSLPVRVQAALTLPEISEHPQVHDALAPHIGEVMQGLLRLSNEVDLDSLTQSARCLVSSFSNELLPFAADMAQALNQSYMRLMGEIADTRQRLGDEDDEASEEKVLVAMNILKTLQQLVVGLEGNPSVLSQVEGSSIPLIKYTLKEEIVEIYDEALELLDSIQFALKMITSDQWEVFEIVYEIFKTSGADFVSEMFPCLDNFISYGAAQMGTQPERLNKLLDIYLTTMTSKSLGCSDRVVACKLADSILLSMRGQADGAVPMFLDQAMRVIQHGITTVDPVTTKALLMHALEVVLNAIYYDARLAMGELARHGWRTDFFSQWFARLSSFKRTHDKKLSILAIAAILPLCLQEEPDSVLVQSAGQLVVGALTLFESLPGAIRTRFELEKEYNLDSDDDSNTTVDSRSSDGEVPEHEEEDDEDVIDRPEHIYTGYTPSLKGLEGGVGDKLGGSPSTLWSDEILWETPLDRVDVYNEFGAVMHRVEASGHPVVNVIMSALSDEQQSSLRSVLSKAAAGGGEMAVKAEIQQSVQAYLGPKSRHR